MTFIDRETELEILTNFDFWFNFVFKYGEEIERGAFNLKNAQISGLFGKKFKTFVLKEFICYLLPE